MEGNSNRKNDFFNSLTDAFGKVIAWGVMLVILITIVTAIGLGMFRSAVKYAIDFTMVSVVDYAKSALLDDPTFTKKLRENVKETVEYSLQGVKKELLQDKAFNQKLRENAKEGIEYAFMKIKNEALNDVELNQKIKANAKESVEYLFDKAKEEAVTNGKFIEKIKVNLKEGIEFTGKKIDK
jgi:diacylglycerol kinase